MNEKLISIIVPVFNTEKYIKECLNSLVNQTYKNLEIIVVDDGSTDHSKEIIETFVKEYSNVKYFYQENAGISAARNLGIENASGEYLAFCDSDDCYLPQAFEYMYSLIEEHSTGLVSLSFYTFTDSADYLCEYDKNGRTASSLEVLENFWLDSNFIQRAVYSKLYRTDIVKQIRFDRRLSASEDALFVAEYVNKIDSVYADTNKVYGYRVNRAGSVMYDDKNFIASSFGWYVSFIETAKMLDARKSSIASTYYRNGLLNFFVFYARLKRNLIGRNNTEDERDNYRKKITEYLRNNKETVINSSIGSGLKFMTKMFISSPGLASSLCLTVSNLKGNK